jgi:spermidine synthase
MRWTVLAMGISTVVAQLYLVREFLTQFQGNEFVIALIFFSWLVLAGMGSRLAGALPMEGPILSSKSFGIGSALLAVLPLLTLFLIRIFRHRFFTPGSSIGFYPTLGFVFITLAPLCLLVGFLLPYSVNVWERMRCETAAGAFDSLGSRIYILDCFGSTLGGIGFTFILVTRFTPVWALILSALPLLGFCIFFIGFSGGYRWLSIGVLTLSLAFFGWAGMAERPSLTPPYGKLIRYTETPYGRVTVVRQADQVTLFTDGVPETFTQDIATAEEWVHYPMSQVAHPRDVLLISAPADVMSQLAAYHLQKVDYVEQNPLIPQIGLEFGWIERIPGLRIVNMDGRKFLKDHNHLYDAILVNVSEPHTFRANRFFTDRFFSLAKSRLAPGGILSFTMPAFENTLSESRREFLSCLYWTAREHFDFVLMIPGQRIYFLCGQRPLNPDIPALLEQKNISTRYISKYFNGEVTAERLSALNDAFKDPTPINRDIRPRLMVLVFSQWFDSFKTSPIPFAVGLFGCSLAYLFWIEKTEFVLFSTGAVTMGVELLVIFAFQAFLGDIYSQIGWIVTVFLAGLIPGAAWGRKLALRPRADRSLGATDLGLCLWVGLLGLLIAGWGDRIPAACYFIFGLVTAFMAGTQFPLVYAVFGDSRESAARLFSADLLGAAWGAVATSIVLIPTVGLVWAAVILSGFKIISFAWLWRRS